MAHGPFRLNVLAYVDRLRPLREMTHPGFVDGWTAAIGSADVRAATDRDRSWEFPMAIKATYDGAGGERVSIPNWLTTTPMIDHTAA